MLHRFQTEMEDHDRMPARVLQVLDHVQLSVENLSFTRCDGRIVLGFVVDANDNQAYRIESLLWKIFGMLSVEVQPDTDSMSPSGGQAKSLAHPARAAAEGGKTGSTI